MRKSLLKLSALAMLLLPAMAFAQESETTPEQKQIQLTFAGEGESKIVETVLVENLTNGEKVSVDGADILILNKEGSGVETVAGNLGDFEPMLYPNPAQGDGNLVFDAPNDGNVTVSIYSMNGQDLDGYNYPIIEVGGMLWMAEDLRPVRVEGVAIAKNAQYWTDANANPLRMAYADFDESNSNVGAYYTPRAAVQALPEGWKLPTANELLELVKMYGGAEKAGAVLKAHGYEGGWNTADYEIDEVQLGLTSNGLLQADGQFKGLGNSSFIVTRSFKDGLAHAMKLKDADNSAVLDHSSLSAKGEGFTVRGVRVAQSPYNAMIINWIAEDPEIAPKHYSRQDLLKNGLQGNPFAYTAPLEQKYTVTSGIDQIYSVGGLYEFGSEGEQDS